MVFDMNIMAYLHIASYRHGAPKIPSIPMPRARARQTLMPAFYSGIPKRNGNNPSKFGWRNLIKIDPPFIYTFSSPVLQMTHPRGTDSHHWDEEAQVEERVAVMPTEGCVIIWWQPMEQHLQAY